MRKGECHDGMGEYQRGPDGDSEDERKPVCLADNKTGTRARRRLRNVLENARVMHLCNRTQRTDRNEREVRAKGKKAKLVR